MMSIRLNRGTVIGLGVAVLAVVAGCGALWGGSTVIDTGFFLLAACLVPPAIMLMVWRRAPPTTVAELLHAVDRNV